MYIITFCLIILAPHHQACSVYSLQLFTFKTINDGKPLHIRDGKKKMFSLALCSQDKHTDNI